jgi:hypothetical protein
LTNFLCALLFVSVYLLVVVNDACPAIAWTSRNEQPTNDAFRAQFVIAVDKLTICLCRCCFSALCPNYKFARIRHLNSACIFDADQVLPNFLVHCDNATA